MSTTLDFAVTWDYRCPFARNFSEHVLVALQKEPGWNVRWVPFSLNQTKVEEGEPDVWDDPEMAGARLAVEVGRGRARRLPRRLPPAPPGPVRGPPRRRPRHPGGGRPPPGAGRQRLDPDEVFAIVATGEPRETFRREHLEVVAEHQVFGVPTVIVGDEAVFVRVMNRPGGDADGARATVERALGLIDDWPELNEFKHTTIRR